MSPTEPALYAALSHAGVLNDGWCSASVVLALAAKLGISTVRLDEMLAEWARCGWWIDSGSFDGYFTDQAPHLNEVIAWLAPENGKNGEYEATAHTFDLARP